MDYLYFQSPQPYQLLGHPFTPHFSRDEQAELGGPIPPDFAEHPLDPAFLPATYDAFTFASVEPTPVTSSPPPPPPPLHTPNPPMPVGNSIESSIPDLDGSTTAVSTTGAAQSRRESSEEKESDLTPAQDRRKAQNRAAQRAFRERKEKHVRDLEAKLSALQSSASTLQSDNERLKLALQRAKTENELLRASGAVQMAHPSSPGSSSRTSHSGDDGYSTSSALLESGGGGPLLSSSATWDLIQSHPLVKQGVVDITDVCERIKPLARCNGQGPVYEERAIWNVIETSRRAGGDELI